MDQVLQKVIVGILLAVLLSSRVAISEEIWRYASKEGEGTWFSTQVPIVVEHVESQQDVDWCHPQACLMKNKSASSATLECKKPGFHPIGPITSGLNNQHFRYIHVVNSPFYYEWYLAYSIHPKRGSQEELRLWIMDPKHMSVAEKNKTAEYPSKYSKQLTKVFFKLGQKPFIKAKVGYRFVSYDLNIYNQSYNTEECIWQLFTEPLVNHQSTVWIDGQSTALYDHFIRSNVVHLLLSKFSFSRSDNQQQVVLKGRSQLQLVIVKDPCAPHVAVLISSKILFTQDNFASTEELKVESNLLQQSEAFVKSVAFSSQNIVVLLESGRVIVYSGTTQSWNNTSGLPSEGLAGVAVQKECFEGDEKELMMGSVLGWSNQSDSNNVYFSKNSGESFQQLSIPNQSFTNISVSRNISQEIEHAELHCLFPIAIFLLKTNNSSADKMVLLLYNFVDDVWKESEISLPNTIEASAMSFTFLPPDTQFMIVWNRKYVASAKLDGSANSLLLKNQSQFTNPMLWDNGTIVSVISGGLGEFVVHLSNNRMFYGRAYIHDIVEVFPGERSFTNMTVMFDMLGSLLLVTTEGDKVHTRKFPLANEVLSAFYPNISCPYLKFTTNIHPELQFIDKGVEMKVWAQIMYPRTTPNGIQLEASRDDILKITTEDHVEHYQGIIILNKTFTFKHELKNDTSLRTSPYKSTAVAVQLLPKEGSLTCENPFEVLHIKLGCPPSRRILIRNCSSQADERKASSNETATRTQNVCQLNVMASDSFKLVLDMYDGDEFYQEVQRDYMVWEETGRNDFGYTATMQEVGCIREAQTWKKLIDQTNTANSSESFGRNIYQNCFEQDSSGKAYDGSQLYEIVNATGVSALLFHGSGCFQFLLRVVDPHLSFCDLTTRFTVEVTADSPSRNFLAQLLSVLAVTLSSTVLLYISYARYTKETLNRHQEDEEEQQRLQELKSIFASFQHGDDPSSGMSSRRPTTDHKVRRFTGTARLMTDQLPEEDELSDNESIIESTEPSNTSLRSKRLLNTRSSQ